MIATTHPVSPEEIMALADGELSGAEASAVAAHIAECAECASLAAQLAATSAAFAKWTVPDAPAGLYASVATHVADAGGGKQGSLFGRTAFLRGHRWPVAQMSAVAAVLLLFAVGLTMHHNSRSVEMREQGRFVSQGALGIEPRSAAGDLVNPPQPLPPPAADAKQAIVTDGAFLDDPGNGGTRIGNITAPGSRFAHAGAADSNGLFHGLGDHAQSSFANSAAVAAVNTPMIARTASLVIVVKDFAASRSALDSILARRHGYSSQLTVLTPENAPRSAQASLRIPATELGAAIGELKTLGRVENESQSGEEVTEQHTDLVERLRTARETEARFETILQQRTGNVAEVLQVEEGIARVRGDIERMETEQKGLEHRVDFATIDIQLNEEYKAQLNPPSASVSNRIRNAFVAGLRDGAATLLGILLFLEEAIPTLLIWLAILAIPGFFLWRRYRRLVQRQ